MSNFNFDEWSKLYETDPDEFERRRTELLQARIMQSPIPQRNMLRMLQLEVDTIRQTHSPEDALVLINEMMTDRLHRLNEQLIRLQRAIGDDEEP